MSKMDYFLIIIFATFSHFILTNTEENMAENPVKYNGYQLLRIDLPGGNEGNGREEVLQLLHQLEADGIRYNPNGDRMPLLDLWHSHSINNQLNVLVAPEFVDTFHQLMAQRGVERIQVLKEDIQKEFDREKAAQIQRKRRRRRGLFGSELSKTRLDLNIYNTYADIERHLREVAARNSDIVGLLDLGKTFERRDLLGVKITKKDDQIKPMIFIDAGVHAREWIAPAAALHAIDKLISTFTSRVNASLALLENFQIIIVPVANPDGYEYSMLRDRLWRKTRSKNVLIHRQCVGADANRNWGYRWAETGASRSPCSNIFPGSGPFSEPESRAIRDFLNGHLDQLMAYISLHSYGQLILSPWGYTTEKPQNFAEQKKLAEVVIAAIRQETGAEYTFGSIADLLYPASGTSIDYWQHRGVPYIYGIELRPDEVESELHGFAIDADQIEPSGREVFTLVQKIGEYLLRQKEDAKTKSKAENATVTDDDADDDDDDD